MPPPHQPFSKRKGYIGQSKEITIWEDAPESLRCCVVETASELGWEPSAMREIVCRLLRKAPNKDNWSERPNIWEEVQELIYRCEWFRVYDIIEAFYARFLKNEGEARGFTSESYGQGESASFADSINACCLEQGVGWRLVNGEIVTRGDEAFERTIEIADLELANRQTTRTRIQEAINDLSRRPKPDLPGAISHAFAAMECIIGDIKYTPEEIRENTHHTFGSFLRQHADLFPSEDFKDGFEQLWKYANNEGSRHGKEGMGPARNEAELIVSLAAALVTYLNRKHPK
jgi:hypothetical protein